MAKNHFIIPIFVPFLGCPNQCVFCHQPKITGVTKEITAAGVRELISHQLDSICQHHRREKHIEVAFFGGSFTGLPFPMQKELLEPVTELLSKGHIQGIRLSTRPDYISNQVLELLEQYGVSTIELGVQSLADQVLIKSKRGHNVADVYEASKLIKEFNIKLGIQLMVGLPGDSPQLAIATGRAVVELKPDFVRIYPTLVLRETELAELYRQGYYQPWSLDKTIDVCKKLYYLFQQNDIPIIRLGLQHSDELEQEHLLAGPYHPAFGELVQAAVFYDILENLLTIHPDLHEKGIVHFFCAPQDESKVRGQRQANLTKLKINFPKLNIAIQADQALGKDIIGISGDINTEIEFFLNKKEFIASRRI